MHDASSAPGPIHRGRDNLASRGLGVDRLNGVVYTPAALAQAVVASLPLRPGARCVDPACGDGVFVEALARRSAREGLGLVVEGRDVDPTALDAARARCAGLDVRLVHADGLALDGSWDAVVGNPPYVEAKRMPDALKARARAVAPLATRGAFDLWAAFVEVGARRTAPGGTLALVLPNRLLVAASAAPLRAWLASEGAVEVEDLAGSGVFGAVGVYPVVLRWRSGAPARLELGGATVGAGVVDALDGRWPLAPEPQGARLLARLLSAGLPRLDADHEVRWTVSFHRGGLRDRFVGTAPTGAVPRRFLGGGRFAGNREVAPYRVAWGGAWIDHDEARARAEGNALPPLALFEGPKLVLPQHVRRLRAALDLDGFVLKDTFLAVRAREERGAVDRLKWLLLVLHSRPLHVLFEAVAAGTRKGGGYLHALGSHLGPLPVPTCPELPLAVALHDRLARGEDVAAAAEALVARAYGLEAEEAAWLEGRRYPDF